MKTLDTLLDFNKTGKKKKRWTKIDENGKNRIKSNWQSKPLKYYF
jgi:hypothetical protein